MTTARITYLDTAMVLIEIAGLRLLTDPVLDPAGTAFQDGPVRLVKISSPPLTAAEIGRIDAVLLSHDQHGDNLDGAGRDLLAGATRTFTTPAAAARLGGTARGMEPWSDVTLAAPDGGTLTVTAVPAQHGPDALLEALGPVTGFVITRSQSGGRPIYISGDTIRFAGTSEIARRFAPLAAAILHMGRAQVEPLGHADLSLSADAAASLALELDAKLVVPVHYEGWRHFTEAAAKLSRPLRRKAFRIGFAGWRPERALRSTSRPMGERGSPVLRSATCRAFPTRMSGLLVATETSCLFAPLSRAIVRAGARRARVGPQSRGLQCSGRNLAGRPEKGRRLIVEHGPVREHPFANIGRHKQPDIVVPIVVGNTLVKNIDSGRRTFDQLQIQIVAADQGTGDVVARIISARAR
jgi:L-ascorbate metabolism protein UlaG (beta-lactamase superfamily)